MVETMDKKKKIDKKEILPVIIMGSLFILIYGLALLLTGIYQDADMQAFENPDNH